MANDPLTSYVWKELDAEAKAELEARNLIWQELVAESDRSVAITGAALLDEGLGLTIRSRLRPCPETEALFKYPGPLGSLGQRIAFAYSLGIVGPCHHQDLVKINDIRNTFAHRTLVPDQHHRLSKLTFKSQKIRDKCNSLWLPSQRPKARANITDPRDLYIITVDYFVGMLWQERYHRKLNLIESVDMKH
jgi:hypothetical protein